MSKTHTTLSPYAREVMISRNHPYFFYKARPLALEAADLAAVDKVLARDPAHTTAHVGEVTQHTTQWFERKASKKAQTSLRRLCTAFAPDVSWELTEMSLISCEWVPPHTDNVREGDVFASLVLGTGGVPYVVSMLKTEKSESDPGTTVRSVAREVRAGDLFIFSPNRAHMATPKIVKTGARLSLLQRWIRVGMERRDWQQSILAHWPRAGRDELLYAEGP
jgi:hypothetical protein